MSIGSRVHGDLAPSRRRKNTFWRSDANRQYVSNTKVGLVPDLCRTGVAAVRACALVASLTVPNSIESWVILAVLLLGRGVVGNRLITLPSANVLKTVSIASCAAD